MNIKEMLEALRRTRAEKQAKLEEITQKTIDESRTKDEAERAEFDGLRDEIRAIDAEIKDLEDLESVQKAAATPVPSAAGTDPARAEAVRNPASVRNTQKMEPGVEFARYAMCLLAAKGDSEKAHRIAVMEYGDAAPRVVNVLRAQSQFGRGMEEMLKRFGGQVQKANVVAATTQDSTWLGPLVDYQNFAGDFVEFLRPQTIIGQFGQNGVPELRRVPFNIRVGGQTSGASAGWVGEGKPKPVTRFDVNATNLGWAKIAAIAVLTEEIIRFGVPSAERLVRDELAAAVIERMDIDFIDPGKAATANVSPASITNGVAAISSTGSDADDIRRDLRALWAPFIAANNPPTTAVYIMTATTALALSLMTNTLGQPEFPGLTMRGGTLGGIPVIVSEYADNSAGSAGGIVVLANARDIWLADDGEVTVDASREASIQMDSVPTNDAATGTEQSLVSMWQTNSVAFRAERYINWAKRRTSAVSWLDAATWGQG